MSKRFVAALLGIFALSILAAFGHEGKVHVMGTIAGIDDHHVIVKDTSGKTHSLLLTKDTKYWRGKTTAKAADLKAGERVMVDVVGEGTKATANEIRLGIQEMPAGHAGMGHGGAKPKP
jgi:hypothetical protein